MNIKVICVLSSLLSAAAHGGATATIPPSQSISSEAGRRDLRPESPRNPHRRTPMPAPAPTNTYAGMSADLAAYLFLHQTRHEGLPGHPQTRMNACDENDYRTAARGTPE